MMKSNQPKDIKKNKNHCPKNQEENSESTSIKAKTKEKKKTKRPKIFLQ